MMYLTLPNNQQKYRLLSSMLTNISSPAPFNPALLQQERQRFHPNLLCHLLQALEGEVTLAALDATPQSV